MAKSISFEQSILDLEAIVMQLEKGELSLDDALKHYEKGIKLAHTCQKTLTQAEQKIISLSTTPSDERDSDDK